jgi:hypothetical protein
VSTFLLVLFFAAVALALAASFGYLPAARAGLALHHTAAIVIVVGLAVAIGVAVLVRTRRREEGSSDLQSRLTAALRRDPQVGNLPILPVPIMPAGDGPVTIEVTGQVSSPGHRDTAIGIIEREAARAGVRYRIDDRLEIPPDAGAHRSA